MRERGFLAHYAGGLDEKLTITTDASGSYSYQLRPFERVIEVDSTLGVGTVKLPPVAECKGMVFSITALTGNSNAVTVAPYATGESHDWAGNFSLNAALDRMLIKSDGKRWSVISDMFT